MDELSLDPAIAREAKRVRGMNLVSTGYGTGWHSGRMWYGYGDEPKRTYSVDGGMVRRGRSPMEDESSGSEWLGLCPVRGTAPF